MVTIVAVGEALVEVMRTGVDQPLDRPGPFVGPIPAALRPFSPMRSLGWGAVPGSLVPWVRMPLATALPGA